MPAESLLMLVAPLAFGAHMLVFARRSETTRERSGGCEAHTNPGRTAGAQGHARSVKSLTNAEFLDHG